MTSTTTTTAPPALVRTSKTLRDIVNSSCCALPRVDIRKCAARRDPAVAVVPLRENTDTASVRGERRNDPRARARGPSLPRLRRPLRLEHDPRGHAPGLDVGDRLVDLIERTDLAGDVR